MRKSLSFLLCVMAASPAAALNLKGGYTVRSLAGVAVYSGAPWGAARSFVLSAPGARFLSAPFTQQTLPTLNASNVRPVESVATADTRAFGLSSQGEAKRFGMGPTIPGTVNEGRAFFDGAGFRLDQAGGGSGPAESLEQRKAKFKEAAYQAIFPTLGGMVVGWSVPHVNKPSFPFVVDRQGDKYAAVASAQTRGNKERVQKLAANAGLVKTIWMDIQKRLTGVEPEFPADDQPEFAAFREALLKAVSAVSYSSSGTLVVVGWGDGDHDSARGYTPDGPKTVSNGIASHLTRILFDAAK